ncbi:GNAT family N-acetyltransferase, partial [Leptospira borgpetersenii serovar Hardjo-bovis]|nr:GNAT family N-acetyltransferase [Leptospira borgpetersenii serovar Hardjo-bovis]
MFTVRPATPVGIDFDRLRDASQSLGFTMLDRPGDHWMDGSNAFSAPGERLLGAFLGDALVGGGGLNRCPFDNHPRAGRVRHLYVSHAVRRVGVGNQLLATLAHHAHNTFDYLN